MLRLDILGLNSNLSCFKFSNDKGTLTPLLGIGVCVSIQFAVLESTKRFFAAQNLNLGRGGSDGKEYTGPQLVSAGALAGFANGVVSGPVEHIRIRKHAFEFLPAL